MHIFSLLISLSFIVVLQMANSNFLKELKLIDSDRRKICYGVNVHILRSKQLTVLFLRQARFAVVVNCAWKFSGLLLRSY